MSQSHTFRSGVPQRRPPGRSPRLRNSLEAYTLQLTTSMPRVESRGLQTYLATTGTMGFFLLGRYGAVAAH